MISKPLDTSLAPKTEERRLVAILFADVSGFTALASRLDPEEVRDAASICFERLKLAILKEGGTILFHEGGLVMALFGYPQAHEDDPEHAVRACFGMFARVPDINRALSAHLREQTEVGLQTGVNRGVVVVGEVGSAEKREHTVMGDAVNLASRLKDLAQPGEVLVSEPVFRATRYLFEYEAREAVRVKGVEKPVKVFRPLREREKPEPKRGFRDLASPLLGRDRELTQLLEAVDRVVAGQWGAAFVTGGAGIGKTRLLEEARDRLRRARAPVILLRGQSSPHGESMPYAPFLEILRAVFGIPEREPRDQIRERLRERTRDLFPEAWQDLVPYLGYLFSLRFEDDLDRKIRHLDPQGLKTQIQMSVRTLFGSLFRTQPMVLVLEDAQWADPASLELLEFLFEAPEPFPILLVALARGEKEGEGYRFQERLRAKLGDSFREIPLGPLSREAGARLLENLLGGSGLPAGFMERVLAKAGGNPFFLEEILRSLLDSEALTRRNEAWQLASPPDSLFLPDTVQAVIASRLDRLEPDVREVLQTAAVLGRQFPAPVLERLSGLPDLMLTLYLAVLEEEDYLVEAGRDPDLVYHFKNPLFQEVAYQGLLKKRRRELHRRAGEAIEELYPDRLEDFAELLALQYSEGEDPGKALIWLKKAGEKARDRYANEEALGYYQQAVALLRERSPAPARELCETCQAIGEILSLRGRFDEARTWYQEMARSGGEDKRLRIQALFKLYSVNEGQSRYSEALSDLEEAEALIPGASLEDEILRANILLSRSWVLRILGRIEDAAQLGEQGLALLDRLLAGDPPPPERYQVQTLRARAFTGLGVVYYNRGEHQKGLTFYQRFLALGEEMDHKQHIGRAHNNLGNAYLGLGDYDRAESHYRTYLEICGEIGERRGESLASNNLGLLAQYRGEYARAEELFRKYLRLSEEMSYRRGVGIAHSNLGGLALETGRIAEAGEHLERARAICGEVGMKQVLPEVLAKLAELRIAADPPAVQEALDLAASAMRQSEDLNSREDRAVSFFAYAKIHAVAGDFKQAETYFQKALAISEEIAVKRLSGDVSLDYARMLAGAEKKGMALEGRAGYYFEKARAIYAQMGLGHKVEECEVR